MKFVHMADLHLDSKFKSLDQIEGLASKRRMEQREALRKIINYIKEKNVELLLIAGDLYEQNYIRRSSIEYVNNLFKEIPEVQILIAPGNHDPYIKNSFYNTFSWAPNVYIYKGNIEKFDYKGIHIYGMGFTDFYCRDNQIDNMEVDQKDDINILIAHGTLDAAKDHYNHRDYNPIKKGLVESKGFNYVALGHVHRPFYNSEKNQKVCYSGSCLSLGFDELGKRGIIVGEVEKDKLEIEFMPIDEREFLEIEIDITEMNSNEEIIERIKTLDLVPNNFYKVILTGKRFFDISISEIERLNEKSNIVKIKNFTQIGIDIEKIKNANDIRGAFVRRMLERKEKENLDEELVEKAIEIGLEVL